MQSLLSSLPLWKWSVTIPIPILPFNISLQHINPADCSGAGHGLSGAAQLVTAAPSQRNSLDPTSSRCDYGRSPQLQAMRARLQGYHTVLHMWVFARPHMCKLLFGATFLIPALRNDLEPSSALWGGGVQREAAFHLSD
eukprot:1161973-Pelagomonas_calceolata.AAC.7